MELTVHKMEPCVDRPSIDGTQNFLLGRGPLSSAGAQGLVKTLQAKFTEKFVLFALHAAALGYICICSKFKEKRWIDYSTLK